MNTKECYVCQKEVNKSLLINAITTIPVKSNAVFGSLNGERIQKGNGKKITLILNEHEYIARINNVGYGDPSRHETLQISFKKELRQVLQELFVNSLTAIKELENEDSLEGQSIDVPKEYLAFYTTDKDDTFRLEPILADDVNAFSEYIQTGNFSEQAIESEMDTDIDTDIVDPSADILVKEGIKKIRKLNKAIGDSLKKRYEYRCQICGKSTPNKYGVQVAEAHHIDYFSKSLNNDESNQMILCPNHHRIIHATNPEFDRNNLSFIYPNGYSEKLLLNEHLKKKKKAQ